MTQPQYGYPPQGDPYQGQYQQAPFPQNGPPPAQYAPAPQYYQAPPPGYGPPQGQYAPQQPPPPLVNASLDDFYNQPSSGGGPGLKFEQLGTRYLLKVSRTVTSGDVTQQTDKFQKPQTFNDGRPKLVLKVPTLVLSGGDPRNHPDGTGVLYVKGQMRDELVRAMTEAGSQSAVPEHDALIDVLYANGRAIPGLDTKQKIYQIRYYLPGTDPAAILNGFTGYGDPYAAQTIQRIEQQLQPTPGQPANYQLQQNPYQQPAQGQPQYAPAPQAPAPYAGQPVAQQAYQAPQQAAQPQYQQAPINQVPAAVQPAAQNYQLPNGQAAMQQAVNQFPQQVPGPQGPAPSNPVAQQPVQPQLPLPTPGQMTPEQQALLGRITNQPQQQQG